MTAKQMELALTALRCRPDDLTITWQNETYSVYNATWLRDNDPIRRDPDNGERLVSVNELPAESKLRSAEAVPSGHLTVNWEDGHSSVFSLSWLKAYDHSLRTGLRPTRMPWLGQSAGNFASCDYSRWMADPRAREDWLYYTARDGVAFLRGVPSEPGTLLHFAESISAIRETHKGRSFDVRVGTASSPLPAHTDQPYRDPVPGFRLLHCVSTLGDAGDSILVDGMAAAEHMRALDAEAFTALCQIPVWFRFQNDAVDFAVERTMLELDPHGEFRAICYNDRHIAPLPLKGPQLKKFYPIYRRLAAVLSEPARQVIYQLQAGDLVIVDNTRILHGHTAPTGDGAHHLQVCYLDADVLFSSLAVLSRQRSTHGSQQH